VADSRPPGSGKSGRPNGFPRAAWATLPDASRREARRAWITSSWRNEALGWGIAGELAGFDPDEARSQHHSKKAERQVVVDGTAPVIVHCDGLCEPNPGGTATYGWVARRGGALLGQDCGVAAIGPRATSNVAEYTAITEALRWLSGTGRCGERIILRSDSQLAIRQLDGTYAVRSPNIYPLWKKATREANAFADLRFQWVRRESNTEADALTRIAYRNSIPEEQRRAAKVGRTVRAAALVSGVVAVSDEQWTVPSASGESRYSVCLGVAPSCTCPDFRKRNEVCKHILAVEMASSA